MDEKIGFIENLSKSNRQNPNSIREITDRRFRRREFDTDLKAFYLNLMKIVLSTFTILLILLMNVITDAQTPKEFGKAWDKTHVSNKKPSNVRHKDLKNYLEKLKSLGIKIDEVGRSSDDREIYQIEWGKGKTKVFMWSQMHGDEPTATSALIDMFAFLQKNRKKKKWIKKLEKTLTIRAVPMLNPDGSDLFQRRNQQGIDINRDARTLETPEAAILMKLRNEFEPEIGFNLHNQRELTTVGRTTNQASISVLAVRADPEIEVSEGQKRNDRICALIIRAMNQFIKGNVARYEDGYTHSAFGDTFSDLGTPVILIESGGIHGKDETFLTKLNFIAFLTALQSLVDGSEKTASTKIYDELPENGGGNLHNYIFRGATVIDFEEIEKESEGNRSEDDKKEKPVETVKVFKPYVADIAVNRRRRRAEISTPPTYVNKIGSLSSHLGLTEFDASKYFIYTNDGPIKNGSRSALLFYKKNRKVDWNTENFQEKFPPDAIFFRQQWLKGKELFVK